MEKELTIKDIVEEIKNNTRESKMVQNFLYKILEGTNQEIKILKEIKAAMEKNK